MAQFGAATTGGEVVAAFPERVKNKTFLITGPSLNGIGSATASALATESPRTLILLARSKSKYQPVIDKIHEINASITVKFIETDLASMARVREAAEAILADKDITAIDALFNNAGIITNDLVRTTDGFESQFAINHLSHFLLTNMLMPLLLTSTSPRVVNISSLGHKYYEPTFQDPHFNHIHPESYNPAEAYAQSKGAQILFSMALNKRYAQKGLRSFAVHPGNMDTGMYNHIKSEVLMDMAQRITGRSLEDANEALTKSSEGGCATGLTAALAPDLPDGVFMNDCQVTKDPEFVAAWAQDAETAEVCWRVSKEAVEQSVGVDMI
ncbi:NAD(P)-binding protein [Fusarium tjaetaba]|uniref:NAD(P)-binding protein n=1 Tax=Fusarium tjaetaba TaxID=1567544 RepID=A0A8H5R9D8_9HYPO|nr:NAD(P)-binding protein [Fusarium tjaetaba]KAF5627816.1 NAD(P)-binding protein [Fusarium tjaetaba]